MNKKVGAIFIVLLMVLSPLTIANFGVWSYVANANGDGEQYDGDPEPTLYSITWDVQQEYGRVISDMPLSAAPMANIPIVAEADDGYVPVFSVTKSDGQPSVNVWQSDAYSCDFRMPASDVTVYVRFIEGWAINYELGDGVDVLGPYYAVKNSQVDFMLLPDEGIIITDVDIHTPEPVDGRLTEREVITYDDGTKDILERRVITVRDGGAETSIHIKELTYGTPKDNVHLIREIRTSENHSYDDKESLMDSTYDEIVESFSYDLDGNLIEHTKVVSTYYYSKSLPEEKEESFECNYYSYQGDSEVLEKTEVGEYVDDIWTVICYVDDAPISKTESVHQSDDGTGEGYSSIKSSYIYDGEKYILDSVYSYLHYQDDRSVETTQYYGSDGKLIREDIEIETNTGIFGIGSGLGEIQYVTKFYESGVLTMTQTLGEAPVISSNVDKLVVGDYNRDWTLTVTDADGNESIAASANIKGFYDPDADTFGFILEGDYPIVTEDLGFNSVKIDVPYNVLHNVVYTWTIERHQDGTTFEYKTLTTTDSEDNTSTMYYTYEHVPPNTVECYQVDDVYSFTMPDSEVCIKVSSMLDKNWNDEPEEYVEVYRSAWDVDELYDELEFMDSYGEKNGGWDLTIDWDVVIDKPIEITVGMTVHKVPVNLSNTKIRLSDDFVGDCAIHIITEEGGSTDGWDNTARVVLSGLDIDSGEIPAIICDNANELVLENTDIRSTSFGVIVNKGSFSMTDSTITAKQALTIDGSAALKWFSIQDSVICFESDDNSGYALSIADPAQFVLFNNCRIESVVSSQQDDLISISATKEGSEVFVVFENTSIANDSGDGKDATLIITALDGSSINVIVSGYLNLVDTELLTSGDVTFDLDTSCISTISIEDAAIGCATSPVLFACGTNSFELSNHEPSTTMIASVGDASLILSDDSDIMLADNLSKVGNGLRIIDGQSYTDYDMYTTDGFIPTASDLEDILNTSSASNYRYSVVDCTTNDTPYYEATFVKLYKVTYYVPENMLDNNVSGFQTESRYYADGDIVEIVDAGVRNNTEFVLWICGQKLIAPGEVVFQHSDYGDGDSFIFTGVWAGNTLYQVFYEDEALKSLGYYWSIGTNTVKILPPEDLDPELTGGRTAYGWNIVFEGSDTEYYAEPGVTRVIDVEKTPTADLSKLGEQYADFDIQYGVIHLYTRWNCVLTFLDVDGTVLREKTVRSQDYTDISFYGSGMTILGWEVTDSSYQLPKNEYSNGEVIEVLGNITFTVITAPQFYYVPDYIPILTERMYDTGFSFVSDEYSLEDTEWIIESEESLISIPEKGKILAGDSVGFATVLVTYRGFELITLSVQVVDDVNIYSNPDVYIEPNSDYLLTFYVDPWTLMYDEWVPTITDSNIVQEFEKGVSFIIDEEESSITFMLRASAIADEPVQLQLSIGLYESNTVYVHVTEHVPATSITAYIGGDQFFADGEETFSLSMKEGRSVFMTLEVQPFNTTEHDLIVTVSPIGQNVLSISKTGNSYQIYGMNQGQATISITLGDVQRAIYVTVQPPDVAVREWKDGDTFCKTEYPTLSAAVSDAESGDTIRLIRRTVEPTVVIEDGKHITIDLNDRMLEFNGIGQYAIDVQKGASVNLLNGVINAQQATSYLRVAGEMQISNVYFDNPDNVCDAFILIDGGTLQSEWVWIRNYKSIDDRPEIVLTVTDSDSPGKFNMKEEVILTNIVVAFDPEVELKNSPVVERTADWPETRLSLGIITEIEGITIYSTDLDDMTVLSGMSVDTVNMLPGDNISYTVTNGSTVTFYGGTVSLDELATCDELTLYTSYEIDSDQSLIVPEGHKLTIASDTTFTVNGTLINNGFINNEGTLIISADAVVNNIGVIRTLYDFSLLENDIPSDKEMMGIDTLTVGGGKVEFGHNATYKYCGDVCVGDVPGDIGYFYMSGNGMIEITINGDRMHYRLYDAQTMGMSADWSWVCIYWNLPLSSFDFVIDDDGSYINTPYMSDGTGGSAYKWVLSEGDTFTGPMHFIKADFTYDGYYIDNLVAGPGGLELKRGSAKLEGNIDVSQNPTVAADGTVDVQGTLSGKGTMTLTTSGKEGDIFIVTDNFIIEEGTTLVLDSDVVMNIADGKKIIVRGTLTVNGLIISEDEDLQALSGKVVIDGGSITQDSNILCDTTEASHLTSLTLDKSSVIAVLNYYGDSAVQLTASVMPNDVDYDLVWWSSDEDICTVDQDGQVTVKNSGTCTIYVSDGLDLMDSCEINSVWVGLPEMFVMNIGTSTPLLPEIYPENIDGLDLSKMEWPSDPSCIVDFEYVTEGDYSYWVLTPKRTGTEMITAQLEGCYLNDCIITVLPSHFYYVLKDQPLDLKDYIYFELDLGDSIDFRFKLQQEPATGVQIELSEDGIISIPDDVFDSNWYDVTLNIQVYEGEITDYSWPLCTFPIQLRKAPTMDDGGEYLLDNGLLYRVVGGHATLVSHTVDISGDLVIPDEVDGNVVIGVSDYALAGCMDLSSIILPDTCGSIAMYAFGGCINLESITLGESTTIIQQYVFDNLPSLTSIRFGNEPANMMKQSIRFSNGASDATTAEMTNHLFTKEGDVFMINHIVTLDTCGGSLVDAEGWTLVDQDSGIYRKDVLYGGSIELPEAQASKAGTLFAFTGWDTEVEAVTKDITYTATYYVEPITLWVGGIDAINDTENLPAGCSYDAKSNTLTLNGANISVARFGSCVTDMDFIDSKAVILDDRSTGLKIVVNGTNTVSSTAEDVLFAINVKGNLEITGNGTLTATTTADSGYGIFAGGDVTVSDATIISSGKIIGFGSIGDFTITSGSITASATDSGDNMTVGLGAVSGDLTINGGTVTASANVFDVMASFYGPGHDFIMNGGTLNLVGDGAIDVNGNITVSGGTINSYGGEICASAGVFTMTGGSITFTDVYGSQNCIRSLDGVMSLSGASYTNLKPMKYDDSNELMNCDIAEAQYLEVITDGDASLSYEQPVTTFAITWSIDGVTRTTYVSEGETPEYSGIPLKASDDKYSYTFVCWEPAISAATEDTTYTALFDKTVNKYTVKFMNGTTVLSETEYEYGTLAKDIVRPADPTKASDAQYTYAFSGWDPAVKDVTGEATYNATFDSVLMMYSVTYVYEGTVPAGAPAVPVNPKESWGTEIYVANIPTMAGYTFGGWSTEDAEIVDNKFEMPAHDVVIKGSWVVNSHTVTYTYYHDVPEGAPVVPVSFKADYGSTVQLAALPTMIGYTLSAWEMIDGEVDEGSIVMPDHDVTIQAYWTVNNHKLTIHYTGYSSEIDDYTADLDFGTKYSVDSDELIGYTPGKATVSGTMGDEDVVVTVTYSPNTYDVILSGTETVTITSGVADGKATYGVPIVFSVTAVNGYVLDVSYVIGDGQAVDVADYIIPGDVILSEVTITSNKTPVEYAIVYNLNGGSVQGNPVKYTIETETFELINPTREGYDFAGWYVDMKTFQTYKVDKGSVGDKVFTAKWTEKSYDVIYDFGELTDVTNTNKVKLAYSEVNGSSYKLTPATLEGYTFVSWKVGDVIKSSLTSDDFTDGSVTVVGTFMKDLTEENYEVGETVVEGDKTTTTFIDENDQVVGKIEETVTQDNGKTITDTVIKDAEDNTVGSVTVTEEVADDGANVETVETKDKDGNVTGTTISTEKTDGDVYESSFEMKDANGSTILKTEYKTDGETTETTIIESDSVTKVVETGDDVIVNTSVAVEETDGTTELTVSQDVIDAAIKQMTDALKGSDADKTIVISTESDDKTDQVTLVLSGEAIKAVSDNSAGIVVEAKVGKMTLDSDVAASLTSENKDIVVDMKKIDDEELLQQHDASAIFQFTATVGDQELHELGGKVRVEIPYELQASESADSIKVFYINGDKYVLMDSHYDAVNKIVWFETDHFSNYMISSSITVTLAISGNGTLMDGNSQVASVTVPKGTAYSTSGALLTIGEYTITATPGANTESYTYAFGSWSSASGIVDEGITITATFTTTPVPASEPEPEVPSGGNEGSSSGGSSSGGSTPTPTPVVDPVLPIEEVKDVVAKDGKVSAEDEKKILDSLKAKLKEDKDFKPEITVDSNGSKEVTLSKDLLNAVLDSNGSFEISTADAMIVLDSTNMKDLAGDVTFKAETTDVPEKFKDTVKDRPVYELSLTSGDTKLSFSGTIMVVLEYVLGADEDPDNLYVAYLGDEIEEYPCTYSDGSVMVALTHFSPYAIMYKVAEPEPIIDPEPIVDPDPITEPDSDKKSDDNTAIYIGAAVAALVAVLVVGFLVVRHRN